VSKYTTGEIAKLCNVTVRTVQYYDSRGILVPTELSEGGRRLYSEADLKRMKIICFLRELNIPIDTISKLLHEDAPESVIELLIEQQEQVMREELEQSKKRLNNLNEVKKALNTMESVSVESIGDAATIMENRKKLKKVHMTMLLVGLPFCFIEIAAIVIWIVAGAWWYFAAYIPVDLIVTFFVVRYYINSVAYICPQCHETFKAGTREMLFSKHTPKTRELTCTHCGHHGFCIEIYGKDIPDAED